MLLFVNTPPDSRCIERFTYNKKAKVPWSALIKEEGFLEDDERIPADPSKLRHSEAVELWKRWKKRQDDGMPGLVFARGLKKDLRVHTGRGRKGKVVTKQWDYVEPDDDDGSEDDKDEDVDELDEDDERGEKPKKGGAIGEKGKGREEGGKGRGGGASGTGKGKGKEEEEGEEEEGKVAHENEGNGPSDGEGEGDGEGKVEVEGKVGGKGEGNIEGEGDGGGSGAGGNEKTDGEDGEEVRDMVVDPHISSPACHSQNKTMKSKFLRGLTKESSYLKMLKIAQMVSLVFGIRRRRLLTQLDEKSSSMWDDPSGLPEWCDWTYPHQYLPPKFHTEDGYNEDFETITGVLRARGQISSAVLLGFGMAIREAHRCQFLDPDEPLPEDMPQYVVDSFVSQDNITQLLEHIDTIVELAT